MAIAVLSIGIDTHRVFVAKKMPLVVIDKAGTRISKAWQVRVRKCAILQTSKDQHDTQILTFRSTPKLLFSMSSLHSAMKLEYSGVQFLFSGRSTLKVWKLD